jgi:hypothetical protein
MRTAMPLQRVAIFLLLSTLAGFASSAEVRADTLTITSEPPGATIEIDGLVSGKTPSHTELPAGYFHKPHIAFNARLEHPVVLRVSKEGYASRQITLTDGPFEWVAITGRRHGNYFLLKSDHFEVKLSPATDTSAIPSDGGRPGPLPIAPTADVAVLSAKAAFGTVTIGSDSPGLDIYVDGKFVGQTPSTLPLDIGNRHIEVKNSAGSAWTRDLVVLANSQINLRADFTSQVVK